MPLLTHSLPGSIEIDLEFLGPPQMIRVDVGELETAILNLALNARDAMPEGGRIDLRVDTQTLDVEFVTRHGGKADQAGQFVRLTVADTGAGTPPDIVERIFEPFFTTKAVDKGTGLGLSMVYGFVTQSGGFVDVYSELGIGTVFRLYFPVADPAEGHEDDSGAPVASDVVPAGARILVVDDENGVRDLLATFLNEAGYTVDTSVHAVAACERLEQGAAYDMLITDLMMPKGLSGFELAALARERCPGI
jgi:CheY-like chemotaxis protein